MSKVRKSARDEDCTLNFVLVCNHDPSTTVLAHLRMFNGGGMGLKPSDLCAVYACSKCHDYLDARARAKGVDLDEDLYWYIARALWRTHERMVQTGVLRVA